MPVELSAAEEVIVTTHIETFRLVRTCCRIDYFRYRVFLNATLLLAFNVIAVHSRYCFLTVIVRVRFLFKDDLILNSIIMFPSNDGLLARN